MDHLDNTLLSVFREVFRDKNMTISCETTSREIKEWDSLRHMQLLAALEREFNITLTLDEMMNIHSVGDIQQILIGRDVLAG